MVESRVGEKLADKLVSELGLMLDDSKKPGRRKAFTSFEDLSRGLLTTTTLVVMSMIATLRRLKKCSFPAAKCSRGIWETIFIKFWFFHTYLIQ